MKLDSIAPNAHYDMVHGMPSILEKDNDGSHIYRFNIAPEYGIVEGEAEESQIGFQCVEIRIYEKPTKANLKKAVIRMVIDETAEFDLVNSYNKHVLGIVEDEAAVEAYREWLQFTVDLGELLDSTLSVN